MDTLDNIYHIVYIKAQKIQYEVLKSSVHIYGHVICSPKYDIYTFQKITLNDLFIECL